MFAQLLLVGSFPSLILQVDSWYD